MIGSSGMIATGSFSVIVFSFFTSFAGFPFTFCLDSVFLAGLDSFVIDSRSILPTI